MQFHKLKKGENTYTSLSTGKVYNQIYEKDIKIIMGYGAQLYPLGDLFNFSKAYKI